MMNKKFLGQFFTKDIIADFMAFLVCKNKPKTILEPALGTGNLLKFIHKYTKSKYIQAFEIDQTIVDKIPPNIKNNIHVECKDYLTSNLDQKFDAIISNPPYHKFHEIKNKSKLIDLYKNKYGIQLSGYTNLYVFFLVKSLNELSSRGRCCYIIPYEFLNTGYGEKVKNYLLKTRMLVSIIKFSTDISLFDNVLTTSCIVLLEKKQNKSIDFINISNIEELQTLRFSQKNTFLYEEVNCKEKWNKYFKASFEKERYKNLIPFSMYAQVKRGIATGGNNFFCLNKERIKEFGLSKNVCVPCITKSQDIQQLVLSDKYFKELYEKNKKIYIFNGKEAKTITDFEYIKYGESLNIHKLFLTSHRNPWFSLENKNSAPILLSVFNRNKIKVIRNKINIKNLSSFHGIYFNHTVSEDEINIFFSYLLTPIAQSILSFNKREYATGLNKFEPNDINNASILNVDIITMNDRKKILDIYNQLSQEDTDNLSYITQLNNIFLTYLI